MKILILLLAVSLLNGLPWDNKDPLTVYGGLSLGLQSQNMRLQNYGDATYISQGGVTYINAPVNHITRELDTYTRADIKLGLRFYEFFSIETDVNTYQGFPEGGPINYKPFQADYHFKMFIEYDFLTAGYEHVCIHSVTTYLNADIANVTKYGAVSDHFYIKAEFEASIIK